MTFDAQTFHVFFLGTTTTISLVFAIGAQNTYILKQTMIGRWVVPIILFCILSDALMIGLGVIGFGVILQSAPWVLEVLRWGGAAFLLWYGISAARRSFHPQAAAFDGTDAGPQTLSKALLIAAAMTYLNPHAWLDTTILLGSLANTQGPDARWVYYAGCMLGSVLWFTILGVGARIMRPLFTKPAAWRILDALIALLMFYLAYTIFTMDTRL